MKRKRKGATSVEYLFVTVLIIVGLLSVIRFFGSTTAKATATNAAALERVLDD